MSAPSLARELEVSVRTILRDIESLSGAGVPVYSVRGSDGGFELLDGYTTGLARREVWAAPGPARRRVAVRVSSEGLRTATLVGRPLRIRRRPSWQPARGREEWVEATLLVDSLDDARLAMLNLGAEVEVVSPPEFRDMIVNEARAITEIYR